MMELTTALDCKHIDLKSSALPPSSRSILLRQDTANETDVAISQLGGDMKDNGLSKDDITKDKVRHKAFRWCQDSMGGAWAQVRSEDELTINQVSGGMSNYLYLISLPAYIKPRKSEPTEVLLRIYGQICKSTLDFLVHNSVVFALLAERKLGPKPFGMYHDGRIEEFIKARPLPAVELREPEIMEMVAERLAQFHALDMPLCKKPRWFKSLVRGWMRDIRSSIKLNTSLMNVLSKLSPDFDMEAEFAELLQIAIKLDCPVVFCHNDLQGGNLLLADKSMTNDTPSMTIIDWEYGHYNYRGYDLGNHFNEWMFNYSSQGKPGFEWTPDSYPTKEQQYSFFRWYLKASGEEADEETLAILFKETNTLALHSHFLWGVWSIVQAQTSSIDFDYIAHAQSRFEAYFKQKKNLPSLLGEHVDSSEDAT